MNQHQSVYSLSKRYGPPNINLRDAEIEDSYGDETYATRPINHQVPEDVTKEDLDFYPQVYAFMEFRDLLFYLYPVALEYEKDKGLETIDSLFYSLERELPAQLESLSKDDQEAIIDALKWIWETHKLGYADWVQCIYLQKLIGISVTWDDLYYQEVDKKQNTSSEWDWITDESGELISIDIYSGSTITAMDFNIINNKENQSTDSDDSFKQRWKSFSSKYKRGDLFIHHITPKEKWQVGQGCEGYAIFREDFLIDSIVLRMN